MIDPGSYSSYWLFRSILTQQISTFFNLFFTYCDFKTDRFVASLPVNHGGLQEGTKDEELFYFSCSTLMGVKKTVNILLEQSASYSDNQLQFTTDIKTACLPSDLLRHFDFMFQFSALCLLSIHVVLIKKYKKKILIITLKKKQYYLQLFIIMLFG